MIGLAVVLHANHRMNDSRACIGIKLGPCMAVRRTTPYIVIDHYVRPHSFIVSIKP
jgi:hypothetical protein